MTTIDAKSVLFSVLIILILIVVYILSPGASREMCDNIILQESAVMNINDYPVVLEHSRPGEIEAEVIKVLRLKPNQSEPFTYKESWGFDYNTLHVYKENSDEECIKVLQ